MKGKRTHYLSAHDLTIEVYDKAVCCNGVVFPWRREYVFVFSGSRCWGEPVHVPAGSYTRTDAGALQYEAKETRYDLDCEGMYVDMVQVTQKEPLQLECTEYVCVEVGDDPVWHSLENDFRFQLKDGHVTIDGYTGDPETILVPPVICGYPVTTVRLGADSLTEQCRSLIISEGISWVTLSFDRARRIKRLEFPSTAQFTASPNALPYTDWFLNHKQDPVYLGGYYCGTPGGGSGSGTELVVAEGTTHIADGADFHCFWHRIILPDSLLTIGRYAFADSKCLEDLRLPKGLQHIADGAFIQCPRLQTLCLPDNLSHCSGAFALCRALKEVSLPAAFGIDQNLDFIPCPRIILRDPKGDQILERDLSPEPVIGKVNAYWPHSYLTAAGNYYPFITYLTKKHGKGPGNYYDCYGNRVKKVIITDPQLYTSSGDIYSAPYWYLYGPDGLTQVTFDKFSDANLVWDGIPEDQIPPEARSALADFIKQDEGEH